MAAGLGARVIEKHFTLSKSHSDFRDHALSADPDELARLARGLHALDAALGHGEKRPAECEAAGRVALRRAVVAARPLPRGHVLRLEDLEFVRPAEGLSPARAFELIGGCLTAAVQRHEPLRESHVRPAAGPTAELSGAAG